MKLGKLYPRNHFDDNLAYSIGRDIEIARILRGITQDELAKLVGTHQPAIARIESGKGLPSLGFVKKIVDALEMKIVPPRIKEVEQYRDELYKNQ